MEVTFAWVLSFLLLSWNTVVDHAPVLVGVLLPPFVEILAKDIKNESERLIFTFITCFLVAGLLQWKHLAGTTPEQVFLYMGLVFMESQAVFKLYFRDSMLRAKIQEKVNPELLEEKKKEMQEEYNTAASNALESQFSQ